MKTLWSNTWKMILAYSRGRREWLSFGSAVLTSLALFGLVPSLAEPAAVQARFDLDDRRGSPFPSDRFIVADPTQNTGLRVNLPKPDCTVRPNDCQNLDVINTLDGFNVQPRLSVPFDGAIDVASITSQTVFLVSLGSTLGGGDPGGRVIGINQVVWDVATATLHVESDEILDQYTRYALLVTKGVLDEDEHAVKAAKAFLNFVDDANSESTGDPGLDAYRTLLRATLSQLDAAGVVPRGQVVAASVFTTQSVTAVLEKIRDQIKLGTPTLADFALGPAGTRAVYPLSEVTDVLSIRQTGTAPTFSPPAITPFPFLSVLAPGAVGTVAFGKYLSPDFLAADRSIPFPGTRLSTPEIHGTSEIYFNLVLPAGPRPPQGWPVVISGHGSGGDKQLAAYLVASTMAAHGIATIAINAVGHGFGPLSTLSLLRGADTPIALPAGGRGIDTNGNGQITSTEGSFALAPRGIIRDRDARIQTAADLMQLVRVIQIGMDVDADGVSDLDPSRVYYFGHSLGGNYGAVFLSAEPSVHAGVLAAPGGPPLEGLRLSPLNRASLGALLAARVPSLINLSGTNFDENLPLRDQPPIINTVPGALEIQELLDNFEWVGQGGDVVAYGPHLRQAPLEGVEPKSVIIQFARGDRTLPNPTTTAILRAGALAERATYYRFDHFLADNPTTPPSFNDPHGPIVFPQPPFVVLPLEVREAVTAVALAAQEQIAVFFASDGVDVIDPDGPGDLFETPIVPPLPEEAVFFP